MAKKKSKKGKNKKAKKIVLGVLVAYVLILALVYAGGVFYYSKHFYSGSKINGFDCAGKTVKEVEKDIKSQIASYELVIQEREDKTETISAAKIGMEYVDDGKIKELKKQQNPFTWFLSFAHAKDYTMSATTTYDEAAVNAAVDQLTAVQEENMVKPANAHLEVTENGYEIIPETVGTELDKEKVKATVKDAIAKGASKVNLEEAGCYTSPEDVSTDENLVKQRDQGNAFLNVTVTIDFADRQEIVDKEVMKDWLVVNEEGNIDLSHEKAKAYVQELSMNMIPLGHPDHLLQQMDKILPFLAVIMDGSLRQMIPPPRFWMQLKADSLKPLHRNIHTLHTAGKKMRLEILMWKSAFPNSICGSSRTDSFWYLQML